jgi:LemA protein
LIPEDTHDTAQPKAANPFKPETGDLFMKKPWLTFAGLCSVVLAIVVVCVIFGSYTSMLRSKNRIHAAKNLMVTACQDQLDLIPELLSLAPETTPEPVLSRIRDAGKQIQAVLIRFQSSDSPLDPDRVAVFEQAQSCLAKDLDSLARHIGTAHPRIQEITDLYLKTIYAAKRYNKEVTYFHSRKKVFPGMFTAGWFNLDTLQFPKIDPTCFDPWGLK